jgi:predicted RNA binding protein YcfA (HicA-like mRNA interferase family)
MTAKEVIKLLEKDGWKEIAQVGSHKQFKHPEKTGKVTFDAQRRYSKRHVEFDLKTGSA